MDSECGTLVIICIIFHFLVMILLFLFVHELFCYFRVCVCVCVLNAGLFFFLCWSFVICGCPMVFTMIFPMHRKKLWKDLCKNYFWHFQYIYGLPSETIQQQKRECSVMRPFRNVYECRDSGWRLSDQKSNICFIRWDVSNVIHLNMNNTKLNRENNSIIAIIINVKTKKPQY